MSPSWFQPPGRAGFIVNSRWKLPKESSVLGFEVYNGRCTMRPPAGSELLPHGAYTLWSPCLFFNCSLTASLVWAPSSVCLPWLGSGFKLAFALSVDLTSFVTHFEWDMAKYPAKQPLMNVVDTLAKVRRVCLETSDHLRGHTWGWDADKVEGQRLGC